MRAASTAICAVSLVADLADHDDVGVGAHHRAQARGEVQPRLGVDLHLLDAGELVLDRVLDGDDVLLGRVQHLQRGVERRRLARAGGPGDEDRAVRAREGLDEALALGVDHPELVEVDVGAVLVEHAQDGRFAAHERQRGHADVDPAAVDVQRDAAVLGHAALGDVEVGHDLDARDHAGHEAPRHARGLAEHAVDAVAHDEVALDGLEVDVGGALLDALADERVHELDDRRVGGRLAQVDDLGAVVLVDRLGDDDLVEGVQALDERGDVLLGRDGGTHLVAAHQRDVVDGEDVAGIDHRDEQRAVVDASSPAPRRSAWPSSRAAGWRPPCRP